MGSDELQPTDDELERIIQQTPQHRVDNIIARYIRDKCSTPQDIKKRMVKLGGQVTTLLHSEVEVEYRERWDTTMLYDALAYQMENECHPKEVYKYILDLFKKDSEWLKDTKHIPLTKRNIRAVTNQIIREGYNIINKTNDIGLNIKKQILQSKTPSGILHSVYEYVCVVNKVKKKIHTTKNVISEVEYIAPIDIPPKVDEAVRLYKQKLTQSEISIILGVSERTIRRWFKRYSVL